MGRWLVCDASQRFPAAFRSLPRLDVNSGREWTQWAKGIYKCPQRRQCCFEKQVARLIELRNIC